MISNIWELKFNVKLIELGSISSRLFAEEDYKKIIRLQNRHKRLKLKVDLYYVALRLLNKVRDKKEHVFYQ